MNTVGPEGNEQPNTPVQQLGAVPGRAREEEALPGERINEPEDYTAREAEHRGAAYTARGAGQEGAIFAQASQGRGAEAVIITTGENDNTNPVSVQGHFGSNPTPNAISSQTPRYAYAGRAAEQPASGGGSASYACAGVAAEQLTGGGIAYTGRAAAEQPTFGGLQAGDYPSNQDTAETAQARRAGTALRQPGGGRRPAQRDASYDIEYL